MADDFLDQFWWQCRSSWKVGKRGFKIMPGAEESLGVMVLLSEEAISVGVVMVSCRLEAVEGRRRGSVGSEENAGKPRAETRDGGGGNASEDEPEI